MNPSEPLTPEERELARLLGRAAPSAPSAALDEAVLGAARAAVQAPPMAAVAAAPDLQAPRQQRKRPRWPAALGLAASVVFAVGIAWQLKPEAPQPPPLAEAAPVAMDAPVAPPSAPDAAPIAEDRAPADAAAEVAAAAVDVAPAPPPPPAPAPARAPVRPQAVPAPPRPAPMVTPPAPPAPASAAPRQDAQAPNAAPALDTVTTTSAPRPFKAAPTPAAEAARSAPGVMRRAAPTALGGFSADALAAAVEADALLPRKQWLKRIRERRDAGDLDTARASLERYLQQYPEARVPRDVRQLLDN